MTTQAYVVTVDVADCAATDDAVALIAPLGIDTELQRFQSFEAPKGWDVTILAEERTGQRAALLVPPEPTALARLRHTFLSPGTALAADAFVPEDSPLTRAAAELVSEARGLAQGAGGGLAGIAAIVADANARFEYGSVPMEQRWYYQSPAVPIIGCAVGNCIDINTYLVAALRAAGYEATYITCYFFDDDPQGIESGMHCWVRTRCDGVVQDWDIAHFKKAGRSDVVAMLNPIAGLRLALACGRDHVYRWNGIEIRLSTPSRPMWVRTDGTAIWGAPPVVRLT